MNKCKWIICQVGVLHSGGSMQKIVMEESVTPGSYNDYDVTKWQGPL